ncbi:hypothetical protein pqer_cds_160 [Pandoravirus quercus]|uniref:Uncharacterized protein n=1 Tax=Pandoravirus quercus TaxID=2107709 RepID=A0A2U7U860_9VIRU|nr:hypothetical protein pqer_cds_160 [Pandoravirus quercus]AVK74582.1 hypothetical protein pqer_cds_160 [Pandoravirus quercus]
MKRRLSESGSDDGAPRVSPGASSPVRKQARPGEAETTAAPWNARRDLAIVADLCGRLADGTANLADLREALRLTRGAMGGGTARARLSTADETECAVPLRAYIALWRTLDTNPAGVAAVRRHATAWPPTFVDVQRAYAALDPESAYEHVRALDLEAVDDPVAAAYNLALAVGRAAQRAEKIAQLAPGDFEGSIEPFPVAWYDVLDATDPAFVGGCDPEATYYIVAVQNDAMDKAALFRIQVDDSAETVAVASTPSGASVLDPGAAEAVRLDGTPALQGYEEILPLFLRALVYDPAEASDLAQRARDSDDAEALSRLTQAASLLEPMPAGAAQVRRALLPVPSRFAVPDAVYDRVALGAPDAADAWFDGEISGTWIDECRLVLALRLFAGQLNARAAARSLPQKPLALVDAAAAAYRGPLARGMIPDDVLDRANVYAWQTTCAAPASASGLLPDAPRLLDVARLWGRTVSPAEVRRPELLCGPLAGPSRAHIPDASIVAPRPDAL